MDYWQPYFDILDWEDLLHKIRSGDPEAKNFADRMLQEKQMSAKMLSTYEPFALPLAYFWLKVKKIWYTNNYIKIKWGPDELSLEDAPFCTHLMNIMGHLFRCHYRENCRVPDCYETYKVVRHLVNCKDKENCVFCFPVKDETMLLAELMALTREDKMDKKWTEVHYHWIHFHSMSFHRQIWRLMIRDMLHAFGCGQNTKSAKYQRCTITNCRAYMYQLEHQKNCDKGMHCEDFKCQIFRRAVFHWNNCKDLECDCCHDLRANNKKKIILDDWKRGDVMHIKFPELYTHAKLAQAIVDIGFTKAEMKMEYPKAEKLRDQFKSCAYHLIIMHHAKTCPNPIGKCGVPPCGTLKTALAHLEVCNDGESCKTDYCRSSKRILSHWIWCPDETCPMCDVIREFRRKGQFLKMDDPFKKADPAPVSSESKIEEAKT